MSDKNTGAGKGDKNRVKKFNQFQSNYDCINFKKPTITEFIYIWPDGREEICYRRPYNSPEALEMIKEVEKLPAYSFRHV
jgi:hypothetical protein